MTQANGGFGPSAFTQTTKTNSTTPCKREGYPYKKGVNRCFPCLSQSRAPFGIQKIQGPLWHPLPPGPVQLQPNGEPRMPWPMSTGCRSPKRTGSSTLALSTVRHLPSDRRPKGRGGGGGGRSPLTGEVPCLICFHVEELEQTRKTPCTYGGVLEMGAQNQIPAGGIMHPRESHFGKL